jgi:5'-3' exonuclease
MSKNFKLMHSQENVLLLVDSLNLAFRWKHSGATNFQEDYLRTIESLKKSYKADRVIVASDQGSSSYRKELYPEYKQNRKDKFAEQTEEERLAFEQFFEDYTLTLEHIKQNTDYPVLRFPGVEADDIAAYICNKVNNRHIWLISSDKDWDLLVSPTVSRFSYVTRKEITWENWSTHYNFDQESLISIKCLMGDAGDNILGVEGIGPKRAEQLVQEYGSTYDIIANIPINSKYKYVQSLNKSKDLLLLNYQLMDLVTYCTEAISSEFKTQINETLENYVK